MQIRTADNIIRLLEKENISITRDKFTYYSKIGLLFAPERKVKKRLNEGIKSFYAEELVDRFKKIEDLKKKGFALSEIKEKLIREDENTILKMYEDAGIPLNLSGLDESAAVRGKAELWMSGGYYQGLSYLYGDIITKLKIIKEEALSKLSMLDSFSNKLLKNVNCQEDADRIKRILRNEKVVLQKLMQEKEEVSAEYVKRYNQMQEFLKDNVYSPVVWDVETEEMIFD